MKTKKFLILLPLLLLAASANAQLSTVSAFSAATFAKATTSSDTSATINIGSYPYVSVSTTSTGSDSSVITVTIDALINGVWSNTVTSAALQLGRPAAHTLAGTGKGQVSNLVLRDGSRIADLTQNAAQIRIRNVHGSGAGDSNAALTYTQKLILRKP